MSTNPLLLEAESLAGQYAPRFYKASENGPNVAAVLALANFVFVKLLAKHPRVTITTLHHLAQAGAENAARDYTTGMSGAAPGAGIAGGIGGAVIDPVAGAVSDAKKQVESVVGLIETITNPITYLRALYIVGGSLLLLASLFIIARELGARSTPSPIAVVGYVGKQRKKRAKKAKKSEKKTPKKAEEPADESGEGEQE